jgi:ATP-binding cassette, subfamily B, bacterial
MTRFREPAPSETAPVVNLPPAKTMGALRGLWPYLQPQWRLLALGAVAILCAAGAVLLFGQGLRGIVDHGLAGNDTASLDRAFMAMLGIIILLAIASALRTYAVNTLGERVVAGLRQKLFAHLLRLSPVFYESNRVGEMLSRLTSDTAQIQTVVTTSLPIALRNGVLLLGAGIMLLWTSFKLTAAVALVVPLVVVPLLWIGRKVRGLSRQAQDRVGDLSAYGDETLNNIKTAQSYTHEVLDALHFNTLADQALRAAVTRAGWRALLSALIIGLVFSAVAIVLWTGGYDVLAGRMTGGTLASFVFYAIVLAGSVAALSEVAGDLQRAAGSLERSQELLQTAPVITAPANPSTLPARLPDTGAVIEFTNVDFSYPSRPQQLTLRNFSLRVQNGERIGIAGPSGAGKTTLFQLLLRFYDPTSGVIKLAGVDLRKLDPVALRGKFAYVGQDAAIFSASLLDNIRYGRPDASMAEVEQAIIDAKVDEFLPRLPDGLQSFLGEKGTRLSGGQKQRVAIARALLRQPEILLLDEATSQLDSENEHWVQLALEKLSAGRTTLMIAHRLSTLRDADRILLLADGQLQGSGTHNDLLANNAQYRNLAGLQET